jgi:hypothetical protein
VMRFSNERFVSLAGNQELGPAEFALASRGPLGGGDRRHRQPGPLLRPPRHPRASRRARSRFPTITTTSRRS